MSEFSLVRQTEHMFYVRKDDVHCGIIVLDDRNLQHGFQFYPGVDSERLSFAGVSFVYKTLRDMNEDRSCAPVAHAEYSLCDGEVIDETTSRIIARIDTGCAIFHSCYTAVNANDLFAIKTYMLKGERHA